MTVDLVEQAYMQHIVSDEVPGNLDLENGRKSGPRGCQCLRVLEASPPNTRLEELTQRCFEWRHHFCEHCDRPFSAASISNTDERLK